MLPLVANLGKRKLINIEVKLTNLISNNTYIITLISSCLKVAANINFTNTLP